MISASPVLVEAASPAPVRVMSMLPLPPARGDELGLFGRRVLVGGVVATHLVGGWALMQLDAVRQAVTQAVPVLMVDLIVPPQAPPPSPPPAAPRRIAPAPAPVIAAAPTPTAAPAPFVAPPPEPLPPPVSIAPAPPATVAAITAPSPAPATPRQIAPSAVRYVKLPELNFPALSKRARESGTVVLRITVDISGRLKHASMHRSSGFERLDQAALSDIRSARFAPYMEDGKAVEWQTLAPLAYEL